MLRRFSSKKSSSNSIGFPGMSGFGSSDFVASPRGGGGAVDKAFVEVPRGVKPGDMIRVDMPDGKSVDMLIPRGAYPGTTLAVERTIDVNVLIPKSAKPGDTLQVEVEGSNVAFTVPSGTKPGSKINLSVPVSEIGKAAEEPDGAAPVHSSAVKTKIPVDWDGYSAIEATIDGKPLLFQAPHGARAGDEVVLDVPLAGHKVSVTFDVPYGVRGGEVLGLRSPSGHMKLISLPLSASPGSALTVRIADEPDDDDAPTGAKSARSPMRAALQARSLSGLTPTRSKTQPMFTVLKEVERVQAPFEVTPVQ